jgi:hypothetical protein
MSERVHRLLDWCEASGIILFNLEIVDYDIDNASVDKSGISVIARHDVSYSDVGTLQQDLWHQRHSVTSHLLSG